MGEISHRIGRKRDVPIPGNSGAIGRKSRQQMCRFAPQARAAQQLKAGFFLVDRAEERQLGHRL
jgi:hypothetical protein